MTYGDQLKQELKARNLTNVKFSVEADISPTTVMRLKKSSRNITIDTLDKAADALGLMAVIKLVPKPETAPAKASVGEVAHA
jgi:transcriptional regulator with XRE-family HTH domain